MIYVAMFEYEAADDDDADLDEVEQPVEGSFSVICEAQDQQEVVDKVLVAKVTELFTVGKDTTSEHSIYLTALIELPYPLPKALVVGLVETGAVDQAMDAVPLEGDAKVLKVCHSKKISVDDPFMVIGRVEEVNPK